MTKIKLVVVLACLLMAAQNTGAQRKLGYWLTYSGNHKINSKWNWLIDGSYRSYRVPQDLLQVITRTGIGYNLNENNNVLMGIGYAYTERLLTTTTKEGTNEVRLFQQYINKQNAGRALLQNRYRLEERFIDKIFHLRLRYQLSAMIPFNNKKPIAGTFCGILFNELFLNTRPSLFDRNRTYAGIGYVLNNKVRMDIGYLTQVQEHTRTNQLMLTLVHNGVLK